jgi:putative transposase
MHLVVTPIRDGASSLDYVARFKGVSSRLIRAGGWTDKVWQARSYDHALRTDQRLADVANYILNNPVRAGLSSNWEDYPWCGVPEPISNEDWLRRS